MQAATSKAVADDLMAIKAIFRLKQALFLGTLSLHLAGMLLGSCIM